MLRRDMHTMAFMRRLMQAAAIFIAISACAVRAQTGRPSYDATRMRAEVDSLNRAMVAAFEAGPAEVARFYGDSARIVGPRRSTVAGRRAIDRYWASIRLPAKWTLEVREVGGSYDSIHQVGVSKLTSTRADGTPDTYECDFVVLWKRQPDGTLRITLDLYN